LPDVRERSHSVPGDAAEARAAAIALAAALAVAMARGRRGLGPLCGARDSRRLAQQAGDGRSRGPCDLLAVHVARGPSVARCSSHMPSFERTALTTFRARHGTAECPTSYTIGEQAFSLPAKYPRFRQRDTNLHTRARAHTTGTKVRVTRRRDSAEHSCRSTPENLEPL
jgi:hypothetical protein